MASEKEWHLLQVAMLLKEEEIKAEQDFLHN